MSATILSLHTPSTYGLDETVKKENSECGHAANQIKEKTNRLTKKQTL